MFPLLELQSEGIHSGMMVSKRQCHPSSPCQVVAKTHVFGERTWGKSGDKVNLNRGYALCDDGVPMASHPNSCYEVIDNSHIFTSSTGSCNSVKKKKVVLYTITIMVGVFCRAVLAIVDPISKNSLIFVYIPSEICSLTIIHLCVSCATICTFVIYQ